MTTDALPEVWTLRTWMYGDDQNGYAYAYPSQESAGRNGLMFQEDERAERWQVESPTGGIVASWVAPPKKLGGNGDGATYEQSDITPKRGERGFTYFDPIESTYGGDVRVSESSAAFEPHIWVRMTCPADLNDRAGPTVEAVAHLTLKDARRLRKQLKWLIRNHYQRRAS